jgi:hypothetical protein
MGKLRPLSWVIIAVNVLFLWSLLTGVGSNATSCDGLSGDSLSACQAGTAIGTGIGVLMLIVLWAFIDIILLVIFLVTNKKQRSCPACGRKVKVGLTQCSKCSYDFKSNSASS